MEKKILDDILESAVSNGDTAGTAAFVADRSGTLYEGQAGVKKLGGDSAFTLDTPQYMASMSKAITSAACMILVEQGRLSLDTTAADILPWARNPQVLEGFDSDDQPRLRPASRSPTLKELLTHSSGYTYEIWNSDMLRYQQVTGTPGVLAASQAGMEVPLIADPGHRWEYGLGIAVAGAMAAEVMGRDLGEVLDELLFKPLGMNEMCFILSEDQKNRMASAHARGENGQLEVFPLVWNQEPEVKLGGEALYGTPRNYLQFLRMLLCGGELDGTRLLKQQTVDQMAQNHIGELNVQSMKTAIPELSQDCDFFPGMQQKWGLSFLINTQDSPEGRPAGGLSWAGLCNSYYWIDMKSGITGAIFNQLFPFFDGPSMATYRRFETEVYKSL